MILECSCGKKYLVKDGSVAPGASVPCKACGKSMLAPEAPAPSAADSGHVAQLQARIQQLEGSLANSQTECRRISEELDNARQGASTADDADSRIAELEASVANLQDAEWQKSRAERDLSAAKAALEMEQAAHKKTKGEIVLSDNRVHQLEEEAAKQKQAPAAADELAKVKALLDASQKEAEGLKEKLGDREGELAHLREEMIEVRARETWFEERVSELEDAQALSEKEIFEVRTQTQLRIKAQGELREKALAARHFTFDLDRNLESLGASLKGLQERVRRLKDTLDVIEPPSPMPTPPAESEASEPPKPSEETPAPPGEEPVREERIETGPVPTEAEAEPAPAEAETPAEPLAEPDAAPVETESEVEAPLQEAPRETEARELDEGVPLIDMSDAEPADAPAEGEPPASDASTPADAPDSDTKKKKGFFSRLFGKK